MSHIHIPAEILLQIFANVRDDGGPNFHLDLLSCSMVSRFWFDCAWPLTAEFFNQARPLDLDTYSVVQIGQVVDAITKLRQLRVWETTPSISVMTTINRLLFEQTAHGSCADATVRLVHALQPPSKALEIYISDNISDKNAANIQDFVSKLYSGTTSLLISHENYSSHEIYSPKSLENLQPLEQLNILIHDLRHQLQDITIAGTYPPSIIQAFSNCPNIRSLSIQSIPEGCDFAASMFSWPELRSLKTIGDISLMVEQLAIYTPKKLESLHFGYSEASRLCLTSHLCNLIISLAPRLVCLKLPRSSTIDRWTENYDELLTLITSLDMPCLRHLDLSQLDESLTAEGVVQRHWVVGQSNPMSLLHWPKLQSIDLSCCSKISPLFLQLVMASCPALEGVRLGGYIRNIFFSTMDIFVSRMHESEAILADAGWTKSIRSFNTSVTVTTFSRPGGNAWEAFSRPGGNAWEAEAEQSDRVGDPDALKKRFDRRWRSSGEYRDDEMDGIVIVRCIDIEHENEFA